MQIILLEKVKNVGLLGDIVKVKDGYARNFLIPQGKAKRATQANIDDLSKRRAELEKVASDKLAQQQALGEKLNGIELKMTQKAGVDGRLFGSVTNADVAEALKAQGYDVIRAMVQMPTGPIKMIGESSVKLALHTDVEAEIKVVVIAEKE
ncbi:MAG: 50S ribosomal protein L9 [Burkholderiales bacterium]|nr:MAG: 50S ribosomal protein L9 [Burkholderiales bacterium]TAG81238.1 MAG: 50S ribosomal protein L9 [Betaproteobacteria bacterium]